jgi:hypothetical protein
MRSNDWEHPRTRNYSRVIRERTQRAGRDNQESVWPGSRPKNIPPGRTETINRKH